MIAQKDGLIDQNGEVCGVHRCKQRHATKSPKNLND